MGSLFILQKISKRLDLTKTEPTFLSKRPTNKYFYINNKNNKLTFPTLPTHKINNCYIKIFKTQGMRASLSFTTTMNSKTMHRPCRGQGCNGDHLVDFKKYYNKIKSNQLHAVSRTQQGRQREPSVKTLRSPIFDPK